MFFFTLIILFVDISKEIKFLGKFLIKENEENNLISNYNLIQNDNESFYIKNSYFLYEIFLTENEFIYNKIKTYKNNKTFLIQVNTQENIKPFISYYNDDYLDINLYFNNNSIFNITPEKSTFFSNLNLKFISLESNKLLSLWINKEQNKNYILYDNIINNKIINICPLSQLYFNNKIHCMSFITETDYYLFIYEHERDENNLTKTELVTLNYKECSINYPKNFIPKIIVHNISKLISNTILLINKNKFALNCYLYYNKENILLFECQHIYILNVSGYYLPDINKVIYKTSEVNKNINYIKLVNLSDSYIAVLTNIGFYLFKIIEYKIEYFFLGEGPVYDTNKNNVEVFFYKYDDWYYKEILFINERHFVHVLKEFEENKEIVIKLYDIFGEDEIDENLIEFECYNNNNNILFNLYVDYNISEIYFNKNYVENYFIKIKSKLNFGKFNFEDYLNKNIEINSLIYYVIEYTELTHFDLKYDLISKYNNNYDIKNCEIKIMLNSSENFFSLNSNENILKYKKILKYYFNSSEENNNLNENYNNNNKYYYNFELNNSEYVLSIYSSKKCKKENFYNSNNNKLPFISIENENNSNEEKNNNNNNEFFIMEIINKNNMNELNYSFFNKENNEIDINKLNIIIYYPIILNYKENFNNENIINKIISYDSNFPFYNISLDFYTNPCYILNNNLSLSLDTRREIFLYNLSKCPNGSNFINYYSDYNIIECSIFNNNIILNNNYYCYNNNVNHEIFETKNINKFDILKCKNSFNLFSKINILNFIMLIITGMILLSYLYFIIYFLGYKINKYKFLNEIFINIIKEKKFYTKNNFHSFSIKTDLKINNQNSNESNKKLFNPFLIEKIKKEKNNTKNNKNLQNEKNLLNSKIPKKLKIIIKNLNINKEFRNNFDNRNFIIYFCDIISEKIFILSIFLSNNILYPLNIKLMNNLFIINLIIFLNTFFYSKKILHSIIIGIFNYLILISLNSLFNFYDYLKFNKKYDNNKYNFEKYSFNIKLKSFLTFLIIMVCNILMWIYIVIFGNVHRNYDNSQKIIIIYYSLSSILTIIILQILICILSTLFRYCSNKNNNFLIKISLIFYSLFL